MGESISSSLRPIKDLFDKICPYFMAIGMSYQDFWEGDVDMCNYYLEAHKIKQREKNEELWLQGYYFYTALLDVAPILQAFAKKGTKPSKYLERPLALSEEEEQERLLEKEKARQQRLKLLRDELIAKSKWKKES